MRGQADAAVLPPCRRPYYLCRIIARMPDSSAKAERYREIGYGHEAAEVDKRLAANAPAAVAAQISQRLLQGTFRQQ